MLLYCIIHLALSVEKIVPLVETRQVGLQFVLSVCLVLRKLFFADISLHRQLHGCFNLLQWQSCHHAQVMGISRKYLTLTC